jgi:outer membrane protein TolC
MDYVLNFHPIAKTANLQSQRGSLYIREAKGNYDPQLNYQNKIKTFNNKNYYFNQLAEFSIPLWWNADLKTSWERNIGTKIDPENSTPQEGLFGLGISVPLTQSLIIDARRNAVLIARQMDKMANADRLLILNDLIYDAALAYLDWALAYSQSLQYQAIINIAEKRREFILSQFENGFASELDTTDAFNNLINRQIEARENLVFLNNARSLNLLILLLFSQSKIL